MKVINLKIGEIVVTDEPVIISTVLGSCISVCISSTTDSTAGMIHYALPKAPTACADVNKFRYGDLAIPTLINYLIKTTGNNSSQFVAKIVGGANQIGHENYLLAKETLKSFDIKIIGEDVGGSVGRKVLFHVESGRLQVSSFEQHPRTDTKSTDVKKTSGRRKVLVVDDSKTMRDLLKRILKDDPELEVIGTASSAAEANEMVATNRPDVITLDINMPGISGVEWLVKLLPINPIPVVMITSLQLQEGNDVFRALELGAIDYIQKPTFTEMKESSLLIREKVKSASFAKVFSAKKITDFQPATSSVPFTNRNILIAIGASTGGTQALKEVLLRLPSQIPPIVIVQHIPPVFSKAFADRLNELCRFEVKEANDGDEILPDRVLIAPGGKQMRLEKNKSRIIARITDDEPVNRHRPSVDYLFNSIPDIYGDHCIGVILTGMGSDGARGLLKLKENGARTIGQDEESSIVYGMPKAALEMRAVEKVAPLSEISSTIMTLLSTIND